MRVLERFGEYVLLERLGQGSMGEAWLARPARPRTGFPELMALKVLLSDLSGEEDFVRRFEHEAILASKVNDPYVVKLIEAGRVGDVLFLALEFVEGWSMTRVLSKLREQRVAPSVEATVTLVSKVLRGLAAIHELVDDQGFAMGSVHRDLSPNNVMLSATGDPKIIDLGLGKSTLSKWKTQTGAVMGSPGYMAPEQVLAQPVDHRADVYSVAVLLFELLTLTHYIKRGSVVEMLGRSMAPVFQAPSGLRVGVPSELDEILKRALSLDPRARPSARELAEALDGLGLSSGETLADFIGEELQSNLEETRIAATRLSASPAIETSVEPTRLIVSQGLTRVTEPMAMISLPVTRRPSRIPWVVASAAAMITVGWAMSRAPSVEVQEVGPVAPVREPSVGAKVNPAISASKPTGDLDRARELFARCAQDPELPECKKAFDRMSADAPSEAVERKPLRVGSAPRGASAKVPTSDGGGLETYGAQPKRNSRSEPPPTPPLEVVPPSPAARGPAKGDAETDLDALQNRATVLLRRVSGAKDKLQEGEWVKLKTAAFNQTVRPSPHDLEVIERRLSELGVP